MRWVPRTAGAYLGSGSRSGPWSRHWTPPARTPDARGSETAAAGSGVDQPVIDNIRPERTFFTVAFDGMWPHAQSERPVIWEHFLVNGPLPEVSRAPAETALQAVSVPWRGDRLSEHDPFGCDRELADLAVGGRSRGS